MSKHITLTAVLFMLLVAPVAACAATPEDEASFTTAVQKAFDSHNATGLLDLTCWDDASDKARKSAEKVYQLLLEEKVVTFTVTPKPLGEKAFDKERVQDGERCHWNLKPTRQIALTMRDQDKKILGIITFAVGEKDGKLRLSALTPAK